MVGFSKVLSLFTLAAGLAYGESVTPGGMASIDWSIENAPSDGVDSIEFSFEVHSKEPDAGYYMAMQYPWVNRESIGYCGVQPHSDSEARAVFSVFGDGADVVDSENCSGGADGGSGVSCGVIMSQFALDTRYYIQVSRDSANSRVWNGTVTDKNGYSQAIGSYQLGSEVKGLGDSQVGFLEYYTSIEEGCPGIPKFDGTWYKPSVEGLSTTISGPSEYGKCEGKANYQGSSTSDSVTVTAGFV